MSDLIPVSAAIVTYHCYEKTREALESIFAFTKGVDLTMYVVDNKSDDDTLEKLKAEFPQIITIQNPKNGGFGYGRNWSNIGRSILISDR